MTASRACTSGASGVVNPVYTDSSPIWVATVPIRADFRLVGFEPGPQEEGRCRLAARSGDGEYPQVVARMPVDAGGHLPERVPDVVHDEHRHSWRHRRTPGCVREHGDGTGSHGVGRELRTVRRAPGQRGEQISRAYLPAARGDAGDRHVGSVQHGTFGGAELAVPVEAECPQRDRGDGSRAGDPGRAVGRQWHVSKRYWVPKPA